MMVKVEDRVWTAWWLAVYVPSCRTLLGCANGLHGSWPRGSRGMTPRADVRDLTHALNSSSVSACEQAHAHTMAHMSSTIWVLGTELRV